MKPHPRYEIIGRIAKGDYATVYRAKDLELDREVAIKQIHQQYLEDPQQLERYWQEAQLLARLEHPRIMTIYDIVRERGWLVLELMQGSLQQVQNGAPIDLNVLRMALTCGLHALHFLQQNGIIHGDVKPSNLLVDKNNRIKLGDFGIARRMTGDPGSIIKGTTKYMAPEVLSDQFGDVGPHSDLYSLGFSAYELMCGSHFDSLFPGLDMFGRDRQIAWMMWHSSQDRRLPEIHRVLQGVPEDLTYVIQKLVEKDPAKRYRTAEEVMHDMQALSQGGPPAGSAEEVAAAEDSAKKAQRKRLLTFAALGVSVALSLGVLFIPSGSTPKANPVPKDLLTAGLLQEVESGGTRFFASRSGSSQSEAIDFDRELDTVLLNDRKVDLADLEPGDEIKIKYLKSQDNREAKEISATRATAVVSTGTIADLDASAASVTVSFGEKGETLELKVPSTVKLLLNEDAKIGTRPVELSDLKSGDHVVVSHIAAGAGRSAVSLHVTRKVSLDGALAGIDAAAGKLVVREGEGAARKTLLVAKECEISLNGASTFAGKPVSLADLQVNDRVQLDHDARVTKITAFRLFTASGVVQESSDASSFAVKLADSATSVKFTLAPSGRVELASTKGPIDLSYLRPGDKVQITHDSPDLKNPRATLVELDPLADKRAWAAVIVEQQYDDASLAEIGHAAADGKLLRETFLARYRVPDDQLLYLENASRLKLEQELDQFLRKVTSGDQLLVYYVGHGYVTPGGAGLLAPREFEVSRADATGFALKSLVARLEACAVPEKTLLLDANHSSELPSSAELIESLRAAGGTKVSTSVTFVASCVKGQTGAVAERADREYSAFALAAADALAGRADANRDLRVDATELFSYLSAQVPALVGDSGGPQTPARYLPDATPERITKGGKDAIRKVLGHLSVVRSDPRVLADDFAAASDLSPKQPEPKLAYGLVLLKQSKGTDAVAQFEAVKAEHPGNSLAHQALAWHHFNQGNLTAGVADLVQLVGSLPRPEKDGEWDTHSIACLAFAGELRQFAFKAADKPLTATQLADFDDEVKSLDKAGRAHCVKGAHSVDTKLAEIDAKIPAAEGPDRKKLENERKRYSTYATFDFNKAAKVVRDSLDKEK